MITPQQTNNLLPVSSELLAAAIQEQENRQMRDDHLAFTRRMFAAAEATPFIVAPFHDVFCKQIDRVFEGNCKRLIILIPPGFGKSELAVINLVARGFAVNPKSRFLHASYSEKLVNDNSLKIKNLISLQEYQKRFPVSFRSDASAKGLWRTTAGGHFLASPAGGSITGFRAGYLNARNLPDDKSDLEPYELENLDDDHVFTGALVIDDPLKPTDAFSEPTRTHINNRWQNTFRSRLAHEDVPVIIIMQRLHINDFVAHVLETSGEEWEVLCLPAIIDGEVKQIHPNAKMIEHGLTAGLLWPEKLPQKALDTLKAAEVTYLAQYMQKPILEGGNVFKDEYFETYDPEKQPALTRRVIFADTASKTKERNDYSVFGCFGLDKERNLYLIDLIRGKWEAPQLIDVATNFYEKHAALPWNTHGHLTGIHIEDASSGIMLIQNLKQQRLPVHEVKVDKDKYSKALGVIGFIAASRVKLPKDAPWIHDFLTEVKSFPDGPFDDQADVLMGGANILLGNGPSLYDQL